MARKKRDEAEIEAVRAALPLQPTIEEIESVKPRLKDGVLIYKASRYRDPLTGLSEQTALVHCTICGEKAHLMKVSANCSCTRVWYTPKIGFIDPADNTEKHTGNVCICPSCGVDVEAVHTSAIRSEYLIDKAHFMTLHNVRGHFVLLAWLLQKTCDKDGRVYYTVRRREGIACIGGIPIRFTGYIKNMSGIIWESEWRTRPAFRGNLERWDEEELACFNYAILDETDGEKTALDVLIKEARKDICFAAYIKLWAKYPQIENLVRCGYGKYVNKLLDECINTSGYYSQCESLNTDIAKRYINVKEKKPHKMLGIEKCDKSFCKNLSPKTLAFFAETLEKNKIRLTKAELRIVEDLGCMQVEGFCAKYSLPLLRTLHYFERQIVVESKKENPRRDLLSLQYLTDYWNMLEKEYGEIPNSMRFPKDLRFSHDDIQKRIREKEDAELNAGISAYATEMMAYAFTDEDLGLTIRPIMSHAELIEEGKVLEHCVATYAKSYASRKTCIFALRNIYEPNTPYFTLEFKKGKVCQNRGKKNCDRTAAVCEFEKKWLKYVKEIKNKEKKNGKSRNDSKRKHSVA